MIRLRQSIAIDGNDHGNQIFKLLNNNKKNSCDQQKEQNDKENDGLNRNGKL